MSGMIGYVGPRASREVLVNGLRKLEGRASRSAGVAWLEDGRTAGLRAAGNLDALGVTLRAVESRFDAGRPEQASPGCPSIGIGHTCWATNGATAERPRESLRAASGRISVALDGKVENHIDLRPQARHNGAQQVRETDAVAVAHLLALHYDGDLVEAVRCLVPDLDGRYAFVALCESEPDTLVGVRHACPLVLGLGTGEQFIASSTDGFFGSRADVAVLEDDQIAVLRRDHVSVLDGARRRRLEATGVGRRRSFRRVVFSRLASPR